MKILWITSLFPSGHDTTKGIYLYRTVKKLSESMDITTLVVYPSIPPFIKMLERPKDAVKTYKYWKKNYPKNPIPPKGINPNNIYYLSYLRLPRRFFNHLEGFFAYYRTKKILREIVTKDTIIHSNWIFPSGQLSYLISKKFRIPYIVSLLGSDVHNLKSGTNYWYKANQVLRNAKKICSVSKQLVIKCIDEGIEIDDKNVTYIDNIYDENEFTIFDRETSRKGLNIDVNERVLFFAGGLVPVKNVQILIKAFSDLVKKNESYSLLLAGEGSDRVFLQNLTFELNIYRRVKFLGNLQSKQLINYFNAADVFCLPSKNEGTPNVIIESLMCGTPVVASRVGGIPNVIKNDSNGYLFTSNNVEELKLTLEKSFIKKWNRQEIRKSVSSFFTSETISKYSNLYNSISKQR